MKSVFLLLLFTCSCFLVYTQTSITKKTFTKNLEQDLNSWLREGEVEVRVTDLVTMSPRRQELMTKFLASVMHNPDLYMKRLKLAEDSAIAQPYDSRLGLTKEEWSELDSLSDDLTDMFAKSSGTAMIKVFKNDSNISFKADGAKLNYLNYLIINTKENFVSMRELDYTLKPVDTFCVTNENNIYKTKWCGYKWEFSSNKNKSLPSNQEELSTISMMLLSLTIGLFEKTGETFFKFKVSHLEKGKQVINYDVPIIFN